MEGMPIIYPPGIRFHPSDEELIDFYLVKKVKSLPLPANFIAEIELYGYDPWELPKKALFGDDEWFFFTPRERKYPNGGRPNRTAGSGFWKATGIDKQIFSSSGSRRIGVKKALVFYKGKPQSSVKTDWIMTEYRLPDAPCRPSRSRGSMRLDDWVLCRLKQKGNMSKNVREVQESPRQVMELPPEYVDDGRDMVADYLLSSECQILTTLLAEPNPIIDTSSQQQIASKTEGYNHGITYEPGSTKIISQTTTSLFPSLFNWIQGQPNEENKYVDFHKFTKMMSNDQENEDPQPENMLPTTYKKLHSQFLPADKFKPNTSNAMMNFQELEMPALSEIFHW